jgi:hypothetical protein
LTRKVRVLIAVVAAMVLILAAGVAYATNSDDTSTNGSQGGKVASQADSEGSGDSEGPGDDADEPGDHDEPGDTED